MLTFPSPSPRPIPPAGTTAVRAVLLDADGVLQLIGTPWREALTRGGGEVFCRRLLEEEGPSLRGEESLGDLLERLVGELDLTATVPELMDLWWQATPDPVARAVVAELRQAGYLTVLATNQSWERRAWMREVLHYDGLCEVDAYSCTLGASKPSSRYFQAVLAMVGLEPHEALFVDDGQRNIQTASRLGLATILHPADSGGVRLREELVARLSPQQG